jgi:hypothetical protein
MDYQEIISVAVGMAVAMFFLQLSRKRLLRRPVANENGEFVFKKQALQTAIHIFSLIFFAFMMVYFIMMGEAAFPSLIIFFSFFLISALSLVFTWKVKLVIAGNTLIKRSWTGKEVSFSLSDVTDFHYSRILGFSFTLQNHNSISLRPELHAQLMILNLLKAHASNEKVIPQANACYSRLLSFPFIAKLVNEK